MNTETTETVSGWVFYDAECRFCRGWAERTRDLLLRRGYHLVPLQAPWVIEKLHQATVPLFDSDHNKAANETGGPIGSQSATPLSLSLGERAGERASLKLDSLLSGMKLLTAYGRIFGGADALIQLTRSIWWAWPIFVFAQIPGLKPLMRTVYRSIARNRHCLGNHCPVPGPPAKPHRHLTSSFYEFP